MLSCGERRRRSTQSRQKGRDAKGFDQHFRQVLVSDPDKLSDETVHQLKQVSSNGLRAGGARGV
jgi:hypothetical protein